MPRPPDPTPIAFGVTTYPYGDSPDPRIFHFASEAEAARFADAVNQHPEHAFLSGGRGHSTAPFPLTFDTLVDALAEIDAFAGRADG